MTQIKQNVIAVSSPLYSNDVVNKGYVDGYIEQHKITINGIDVNKFEADGSVSITVEDNIAKIRSLPTFCYGDPSVAKELADSGRVVVNGVTVEPEPVTVFWVGTSRSTGEVLTGATGMSPGLPWALHNFTTLGLGTPAWTGVYINTQANIGVSAFGSWLGRYTPGSACTLTCNGTNAPGGNDASARFDTGTLSTANRPYSASQFQGRVVTLTAPYMVGPNGITGAHVRFGMFGNGANFTHVTDYFSTYNATYELRFATVTIPNNWDWVTYPNLITGFAHRQGQATIDGETFTSLMSVIVTTDIGVSIVNAAVGGRWTRDYIDETIFDRRIFTDHLLAYPGSRKQLWIELGCNGDGIVTLAQEISAKRELINRFRAVFPDGKVLFITSYPSAGQRAGSSTDYRDADLQIARDSGVLVIDTHMAMPGYIQAVSLGYMADTVHYNDVGRAAWMVKITNLLNQCASVG